MGKKLLLALSISFFSSLLFAQEENYSILNIEPSLLENANAVVRNEALQIEILAIDKMKIHTSWAITLLNKKGDNYFLAGDFYDDNSKVIKQEAIIYDKFGKQVKRYKRRNFTDRSYIDNGTIFSDTRLKYVDPTAPGYPYTVYYTSEVEMSSTAFVRSWRPIPAFHLSVVKSFYSISYKSGISLRIEEKNFDGLEIQKKSMSNHLQYSVENLPAFKREVLSPDISSFAPDVLVALNEFSLEGVWGVATNWSEMGKWQYDNLIKNKISLSPGVVGVISDLVADAKDDREKTKRIYKYMQGKTRYVSVQLGIGGWEPMFAEEVDKLGYGDCKALTNYTRALLASQGIESNYAVVYAGRDRRDIDPNFASMQGNHVILNVPLEDEEDVWLECTSQTHPFNYLGDFTDDRKVLLVKSDGGEIVTTPKYEAKENFSKNNFEIVLDPEGAFSATGVLSTRGISYAKKSALERRLDDENVLSYKERWGHLKNLSFEKLQFENNEAELQFYENLKFSGSSYASKAGKSMLLPLNFFYPGTISLPRAERKLPIEIQRGYMVEDTFNYVLPEGYVADFIPEEVQMESQFGTYSLKILLKEIDGAKIIAVERSYSINDGIYPPEAYEDLRDFMQQLNSYNNLKAVLVAHQ